MAQNRAWGGYGRSGGLKAWRVCRLLVADSHHLDKEQYPDPDPHYSYADPQPLWCNVEFTDMFLLQVGEVDAGAEKLISVTRDCLYVGIQQCGPNKPIRGKVKFSLCDMMTVYSGLVISPLYMLYSRFVS